MTPSILPKFGFSALDSAASDVADMKLAATIYAFDVPLYAEAPYTVSAGDGITGARVVFHFKQSNPAGNSPGEICKRWVDGAWLAGNPTNPLAICKQAFHFFDDLRRWLQIGRGPESWHGPAVAITNTRKAAVMMAMGHPLRGWRRNDRVTTWCFHEAAAVDAALYDDPALYDKLPDASISYAKGAILGHERMIQFCKDIQFARVEHRGRAALIGRDMPKERLNQLERILYRK